MLSYYGNPDSALHYLKLLSNSFGVRPSSFNKTVSLRPRLPQSWKTASLNNIKVGDNVISMAIESSGHTKTYTLSQSRRDWMLVLDIQEAKEVFVNGNKIATEILRVNPNLQLMGKKNIVVVKL